MADRVPAFTIKALTLSQVERKTLEGLGKWYSGSSIIKGAGSPWKILVFLRIKPVTITAKIPAKYQIGPNHHAPPQIAANIAIISVLAPQGIMDATVMVIRLSLSFSMVLVAIIPGTEQPVPTKIGIKDLPDRPNFLKTLSKIKAILAM